MLRPPDAPPTQPDAFERAIDAAAEGRTPAEVVLDAVKAQRAVEAAQARARHTAWQEIDAALSRILALWSA